MEAGKLRSLLLILIFVVGVTAQIVPANKVEVTPTYPDGVTAAENVIVFTNPNGNYFGWQLGQFLQGNNPNDDVVCNGWNVDGNFPGEPTLRFCMERAFGTGDDANYEMYYEMKPAGPIGYQRPWFWAINRLTGAASVVTAARATFYSGNSMLQVGPAETLTLGPVRHQTDSVIFETVANQGAPAKQIRIIPDSTDSGKSVISFGGTATLSGNGADVQTSGPISASAVKVNGAKVVGAQCSAIPDPDPATGRMGETNNVTVIAILNCLRSHGLVAQ